MQNGNAGLRTTATPRTRGQETCSSPLWVGEDWSVSPPGAIGPRPSLDSCPKRLLSASDPREVAKIGGSQMNRAGAANSPEHFKSSRPYPTGTQLRAAGLAPWSCPTTPRHSRSLPLRTPETPGATVSATFTSGSAPTRKGTLRPAKVRP